MTHCDPFRAGTPGATQIFTAHPCPEPSMKCLGLTVARGNTAPAGTGNAWYGAKMFTTCGSFRADGCIAEER